MCAANLLECISLSEGEGLLLHQRFTRQTLTCAGGDCLPANQPTSQLDENAPACRAALLTQDHGDSL